MSPSKPEIPESLKAIIRRETSGVGHEAKMPKPDIIHSVPNTKETDSWDPTGLSNFSGPNPLPLTNRA